MGISVEDAVKELQARETVFVAYSQATKLPYVTCGEETLSLIHISEPTRP